MKTILTVSALLLVTLGLASAQTQPAPEIDPAFGTTALTLLGGAVLVFRARRK